MAIRTSEEKGITVLLRRVTWARSRLLRVMTRTIKRSGEREWSEMIRWSRIRGSLVNTIGRERARKLEGKPENQEQVVSWMPKEQNTS